MRPVFVVMGVAGCGKSTIGQALADYLGCPFYDGDDYHPPANIAKMSAGIPLNDDDRAPWLAILASLLQEHIERNEAAVLACSALKESYRDILRVSDQVQFIFLVGDFELIWGRMETRQEHYMKPEMLRSQFADLEPPATDEALHIPVDRPVEEIMAQIVREI
jgi:gluconokinase